MLPLRGRVAKTCSGMGSSRGDSKDGVGAEVGLVGGAIHLDHEVVDLPLLGRVEANESWGDLIVHLVHSSLAAFAEVTGTTIAELTSLARESSVFFLIGYKWVGRAHLVDASGSTGRHNRTEKTVRCHHVHLHGWVTTRVDDFAGFDGVDGGCHTSCKRSE